MSKNDNSGYCIYGFALLLAVIILLIVYPGYMSYDSLHALREARNGVQGGSYPPFVSYVWRLFDNIWPGPSLMLLVQNSVLFLAFAHILRALRLGSHWTGYLLMILFASFPPLLGSMVVVWKDVAVASCLLVVVAIMMQMQQTKNNKRVILLFISGCFFLFSGMAYRFNAASGALPLMLFLYWLLLKALNIEIPGVKKKIAHACFALVIFFVMFSLVYVMNSYRLTDFEKLNKNSGFAVIALFDLIGISKYEKRLVIAKDLDNHQPDISPELLDKIYDPRHLNITRQKLSDLYPVVANSIEELKSEAFIFKPWIENVKEYPFSYLAHRGQIAIYLTGFNNGPEFYPTHYGVSPNEYGIELIPNELNKSLVDYVTYGVDSLKLRPWIVYLVIIIMLPFFLLFSKQKDMVLCLFFSSALYLIPMFIILPAADLRYNFWSIVSCVVCLIIGFASTPAFQKYLGCKYEDI